MNNDKLTISFNRDTLTKSKGAINIDTIQVIDFSENAEIMDSITNILIKKLEGDEWAS